MLEVLALAVEALVPLRHKAVNGCLVKFPGLHCEPVPIVHMQRYVTGLHIPESGSFLFERLWLVYFLNKNKYPQLVSNTRSGRGKPLYYRSVSSKGAGRPRLTHHYKGWWSETKCMRWVWRNGGIKFMVGENGRNPEKNLPRPHFVPHETHMEWPKRELRTPAVGGERLTACAKRPPRFFFNAPYIKLSKLL